MKCDIIIPIWNQLEATKSCIEHIVKNTQYPYGLILVDNGSDFETRDYLVHFKKSHQIEVILIRNNENLGFIKAANQGIKASRAPYICLLNNDTLPATGWLKELVEFAEKYPDVGLLNPLCSGHLARNLSSNEYAKILSSSNKGKYMEMNQCQGFCMLIKREVVNKIGYLDERFGLGGFEDTDYSMRAHHDGYRSVCVYASYVYHIEHRSFDAIGDRKKIQSESEKAYFNKWPRHQRTLSIFSISDKTEDKEIENFLKHSLYLARTWCWANLLLFGDKATEKRVNDIKINIDFPLHQNIKFNYLNNRLKILEITARIMERAFGSKSRKRYDIVFYNKPELEFLLKKLCSLQKCIAENIDFGNYSECLLNKVIVKKHSFNMKDMRCDIILPVCDQYEFTKKCIESIIKNTDTPYRLIVINNGQNPLTRKFLNELETNKKVETTNIHNERNIGWVKALNKGIEISDAPYACFQNDDTIVTRGWLRKMIGILKMRDDFGMINPAWEGRPPNLSVDKYNDLLERKSKTAYMETDWCRGFCTVIKRPVIEKIGKVDEAYGLAYFDDVDYSVKAIENGFLALRALNTYVYHHRNATFFEILKGNRWNELHEKNKLIYYKKWGRPLKIVMILNNKVCNNKDTVNDIEETVFHLARKQHHIQIWSPCNFIDRFKHTNVRLKIYPPPFFRLYKFLDLYLNKKRKIRKRYDAVFTYDAVNTNINKTIKDTVRMMKEQTKESINV